MAMLTDRATFLVLRVFVTYLAHRVDGLRGRLPDHDDGQEVINLPDRWAVTIDDLATALLKSDWDTDYGLLCIGVPPPRMPTPDEDLAEIEEAIAAID